MGLRLKRLAANAQVLVVTHSPQVAARAAGVKAVVPLVVCFLPAFLLVGVVPLFGALASRLG